MSKPTNSGMLDLSKAVAVVHPHRTQATEQLDLDMVDKTLLVAAGDAAERISFFDFDTQREPYEKDGRHVLMSMDKRALLFDYRSLENVRINRAMITIPPKVRENIASLFGEIDCDDVMFTTCIVALADFAALHLMQENKRLHVMPATDNRSEERRKLRKQIADHSGRAR